jgi:hypothetical protein
MEYTIKLNDWQMSAVLAALYRAGRECGLDAAAAASYADTRAEIVKQRRAYANVGIAKGEVG